MLGFYIIGLRMPFIAVFAAHAAMAGAVFGDLAGLDHTVSGFAGALAGAAATRVDPGVPATSIPTRH